MTDDILREAAELLANIRADNMLLEEDVDPTSTDWSVPLIPDDNPPDESLPYEQSPPVHDDPVHPQPTNIVTHSPPPDIALPPPPNLPLPPPPRPPSGGPKQGTTPPRRDPPAIPTSNRPSPHSDILSDDLPVLPNSMANGSSRTRIQGVDVDARKIRTGRDDLEQSGRERRRVAFGDDEVDRDHKEYRKSSKPNNILVRKKSASPPPLSATMKVKKGSSMEERKTMEKGRHSKKADPKRRSAGGPISSLKLSKKFQVIGKKEPTHQSVRKKQKKGEDLVIGGPIYETFRVATVDKATEYKSAATHLGIHLDSHPDEEAVRENLFQSFGVGAMTKVMPGKKDTPKLDPGMKEVLEELGLSKYSALFAEQEVDMEAWMLLTPDDYRDMGIPFGPARKLRQRAEARKEQMNNVFEIAEAVEEGGKGEYNRWEIDIKDIKLIKRVGAGSFGAVYMGSWRNSAVAIKKLFMQDLSDVQLSDFRREVSILMRLRPHRNVTQFLGVCSIQPNLCLVTEWLPLGDLKGQLKKKQISMKTKLNMMRDVAAGMAHLHAEEILHCDLAARNLLCTQDYSVKVTDFGLSKTGTQYTSASGFGPIKWMSPEALDPKKRLFTTKNDVWSFGVLIWEILHDAEEPYGNISPAEVGVGIMNQTLSLDIPTWGVEGLPNIIRDCMHYDMNQRPTFNDLFTRLDTIIEQVNEGHISIHERPGYRGEVTMTSPREMAKSTGSGLQLGKGVLAGWGDGDDKDEGSEDEGSEGGHYLNMSNVL